VGALINLSWVGFWIYWLTQARHAKPSRRDHRHLSRTNAVIYIIMVMTSLFFLTHERHAPHGPRVVGLVLVWCGFALAIAARRHLRTNWGRPMSQRVDPELITSGPYRYVRHPIYSGMLVALIGTAIGVNYWLGVSTLLIGYFFVIAMQSEEEFLRVQFPDAYSTYAATTPRLFPHLFHR
jgi:protein-S-isoprenylcysteine O-methyltransferase Ste14